ncbi:YbhN family protein [Thermodesulfobacteriota bacterium]
MNSGLKKKLVALARWGVSLLLLFVVVRTFPADELVSCLQGSNVFFLCCGFVVLMVRHIVSAYRWKIVLEIKNYYFPVSALTRYCFIGVFFNNFLPTSMGGDVVRGMYLVRDGVRKRTAASSLVVERMLGVFALACLCGLAWLARPHPLEGQQGLAVALALCGVVFFALLLYASAGRGGVIRSSGLLRKLLSVLEDFKEYGAAPRKGGGAFLLSLLFQLACVAGIYFLARSITHNLSFRELLFCVPLASLASMLPVSINGLGVREGAFVVLASQFGVGIKTAAAISLVWLGMNYLQSMAGGLLFVFDRIRLKKSEQVTLNGKIP